MAICDPAATVVQRASTPRVAGSAIRRWMSSSTSTSGARSSSMRPTVGKTSRSAERPAPRRRARSCSPAGSDRVEGQRHVASEVHGVVVGRRQLHPGERPLVGCRPQQQRAGLAVAGRRGEGHDRRLRAQETLHQVVSGQEGLRPRRYVEPGCGYVARPYCNLPSCIDRRRFDAHRRHGTTRFSITEA